MRTIIVGLLVLSVNLTSCQTVNFDKKIVGEFTGVSILDAPFMIDELIEIFKTDTLCIKRAFNQKIFDRTEYTRYCYNVCTEFFYNRLQEKKRIKTKENNEIIDRIIGELQYKSAQAKPQIDWAAVYKTCLTCPFAEYPDELFFYFKFSILFMGELEISEMINYAGGEQWKYALMAIKGGDSFTLSKEDNYTQYVLDRRMATYIIDKWKDSKIPQVQELIAVYKSVM